MSRLDAIENHIPNDLYNAIPMQWLTRKFITDYLIVHSEDNFKLEDADEFLRDYESKALKPLMD
jgi:hypothetical protein